jgi:hypothetical protein
MTSPALAVPVGTGRGYIHPLTKQTVPSVTTILGVLDKPALPRWAAKETAQFAIDNKDSWVNLPSDAALDLLKGAAWRKRDRAADAGTDAHSYMESLMNGSVSIDAQFDPPGLGRAAENIRAILKRLQPVPISIEGTVWSHNYGYAGSYDAIVQIDGKTTLIDLKTSTGVYADYALQLSAYKYAESILLPDGQELVMPEIQQCQIWHAPKDGKWSIVEVDVDRDEFNVFLSALKTFQWKNERAKTVLGKKIQS